MHELAAQERFEEAALARDRVRALADILARMRIDRWLTAGRLVVAGPAASASSSLVARWSAATGGWAPVGRSARPPPASGPTSCRSSGHGSRRNRVRVLEADTAPAEPVDGGAELARLLGQIRAAEEPGAGRRRGRDRRARVPVPVPTRR